MKKNIILGLILLVVPVLILAQPDCKGKAESGCQGPKGTQEMQCQGQGKMPMSDMLKLTDQQKADQKKIRLKYQRQNIPLRSDLKLANIDLEEAIENLDQKKIDESVKKISDISAKLFKNKIDQKVEFLKLLTDEQKKMLKDRPRGMQKMKRIKMMEGPGGCGNMGLIDREIDLSYDIDPDLPSMDMEVEIQSDLED